MRFIGRFIKPSFRLFIKNKLYSFFYKGLPLVNNTIQSNRGGRLYIFYRISDAGYKKEKLPNINNENCLKNAVSVFPSDKVHWKIICDNCCQETMNMVRKYLPEECIEQVSIGHGAGTFNLTLDKALELDDDAIVYFLENDYLHLPVSLDVINEGFNLGADVLTLYDHPDKYEKTHPLFYFMNKNTHVYLGKLRHWKTEFSTTMTFAARVKFLKKYEKILRKWTKGRHPFDFNMFNELYRKGVELICPIPGCSTHGETAFLCPMTDWEKF